MELYLCKRGDTMITEKNIFKKQKSRAQTSIEFILIFSMFMVLLMGMMWGAYERMGQQRGTVFNSYIRTNMNRLDSKINLIMTGGIGDTSTISVYSSSYPPDVENVYISYVEKETSRGLQPAVAYIVEYPETDLVYSNSGITPAVPSENDTLLEGGKIRIEQGGNVLKIKKISQMSKKVKIWKVD